MAAETYPSTRTLPLGTRSFLFLQGMKTDFFARLGTALAKRGHRVYRINFNGGDKLFWRLAGAENFRGDRRAWPRYLQEFLQARRITDLIVFGEYRPYHKVALELAASHGIRINIFDEGYFRPSWITLEQRGPGEARAIRRDPLWLREAASQAPDAESNAAPEDSYVRRALQDVLYNAAAFAARGGFPHYETHRPWPFYVEYASGARRILSLPMTQWRNAAQRMALAMANRPYYLFPLQLDSDYQIREQSPFGKIEAAIGQVVASFAHHAPSAAALVVTEHPLDNGINDWRRAVDGIAAAAGVRDRVFFLRRGTPKRLLTGSAGVVVINSTLGLQALELGKPVVALGNAVYDVPGLTFQGGLDQFWVEQSAPDMSIFDSLRRVLVAYSQIGGGFFSRKGLRLAVAGAIERLEQGSSPEKLPDADYGGAPDDALRLAISG
jgi:capsular polysaccharide export protein